VEPSGRYRPISGLSAKQLWGVVFLCAFGLYLGTAQREISWQDSGMFQWRILTADYTGALGLALAHPLYILVAQLLRLLPVENPAWPINAFSGLGMAVALANFSCLARALTRSVWIALAVTGMVMFCHAAWWLSTVAEVYTWVVAGLTTELLLLIRLNRVPATRHITLLALVSGLGWSLHNLALLPVPVYIATHLLMVRRGQLPPASIAAAAIAFVAGSSLYLGLTAQVWLTTGQPATALASALFGHYREAVLNIHTGAGYWRINAALSGLSFLNVLLPLAVVGWLNLTATVGRPTAVALSAITGIEGLFWVRYPVPDQFTFILPTLVMVAVAAAVGLRVLVDRHGVWRSIAVAGTVLSIIGMPIVYGMLPHIVDEGGRAAPRARTLPFRNELNYWIQPWKHHETSARQFAAAALTEASPDGIILADETSVYPLLLMQQRRADAQHVTIQHQGEPLPSYDADPVGFVRATAGRTVFVVSPVAGYMPPGMTGLLKEATFALPPGGVLYRMER